MRGRSGMPMLLASSKVEKLCSPSGETFCVMELERSSYDVDGFQMGSGFSGVEVVAVRLSLGLFISIEIFGKRVQLRGKLVRFLFVAKEAQCLAKIVIGGEVIEIFKKLKHSPLSASRFAQEYISQTASRTAPTYPLLGVGPRFLKDVSISGVPWGRRTLISVLNHSCPFLHQKPGSYSASWRGFRVEEVWLVGSVNYWLQQNPDGAHELFLAGTIK